MSAYGYRRGSIFWALTLIGVGAIFLYNNFNPAIRPWYIIAKFWPILIIFWGLSKLVDYLQAQAHPETTPPPLFSASEVILLILILLMGSLVSKIVLNPWQHWPEAMGIEVNDEFADLFLDSYTYTETLTQPAKSPASLLAVVRRGNVEIHGSDQANIEAVVTKTVRAPDQAAAKKIADEAKVEIVEQAGRYLLKTNLDSLPANGRNVRLDVMLRVPKNSATEITTERGDIVLDGVTGDQNLTGHRGDVRVTNVEGLVRIHKSRGATSVRDVKGSVEVDGRGEDVEVAGVSGTVAVNGEFSGSVQFRELPQSARFASSRTDMTVQKLTGRLNMELGSLDASGIDGPIEISTRQKDISLEDFKHMVKIANTNGDVRLRTETPPRQPIDVDLKKGQIDLTLPSACNFQIDATSRNGDVECDFAAPGLVITKEGSSPSIKGTYGKGGPAIRLETTYGTVRLMRLGAHPSPPAVPSTPAAPPAPPTSDEAKRISARHQVPSWERSVVRAVWMANREVVENVAKPAWDVMQSWGHP
ncbi:MAG TPA: DUF4097 family beta strand repeat-containing protein [Terriglobia bacterium]|nr:DUF4097 family beta strand repeat-containing protein [Terriglobia bacterium]